MDSNIVKAAHITPLLFKFKFAFKFMFIFRLGRRQSRGEQTMCFNFRLLLKIRPHIFFAHKISSFIVLMIEIKKKKISYSHKSHAPRVNIIKQKNDSFMPGVFFFFRSKK